MSIDTRERKWGGNAPRMRELSHGHGEHDTRGWHWFARGPIIAADGGRPEDDEEARDVETEALRDVSHEPAHGEGTNQVWDRGEEDEEGADPE